MSRLSLVRYALAFALFAVTVPATPAHAFVCLRINGNGPCARWLQGSTTARSFLGTPSSPLINGTVTWDQNAINAANDWNAAGGAFGFNVTTGGTFINPCGPAGAGHVCPNTGPGGDNPVFFADSFCGQGFGDIIELTNNCADINSGGMLNAPVFVNSAVSWNAYDGPLRTANNRVIHDIRRVLVHELGHVLGLDHPDDNGQSVSAIMNSRESNIDRLQQDDIDGLFSLYPNGGLPPGRGDASGCTIANRGTPTNAWMLLAPAVLALLRLRRRPRWSASG